MASAPTNSRYRNFKRRGLITEGKVLIPSKIVITYRFKKFTVTADILAPAPTISCYGIIINNAHGSTAPTDTGYGTPVLLNRSQAADVLYNSHKATTIQTYGPDDEAGTTAETSQVIYLENEYLITNFVARLHGLEKIAKIREVVLFARPDEFSDEQEYVLT